MVVVAVMTMEPQRPRLFVLLLLILLFVFLIGQIERHSKWIELLLKSTTVVNSGTAIPHSTENASKAIFTEHLLSQRSGSIINEVDDTWHRSWSNGNSIGSSDKTKKFPTIEFVMEMATLSSLIYAFHTEDYGNDDINNTVCDRINRMNRMNPGNVRRHDSVTSTTHGTINNRTVPPNIHCEWYHHDWIDGTQIMIVSSKYTPSTSSNTGSSITIIFAGTDDMTTSLTDVDVYLSPYGYPKDTSTINTTRYPIYNVTLSDPNVRVHTGFDTTLTVQYTESIW